MALCEFSHTVKYGDVFHAPCEPFEVYEKDLDELTALGAKVLSRTEQDTEDVSKPQAKTPSAKKPYKIPAPTKKG